MGFVTNEIPESLTEYNAYAGLLQRDRVRHPRAGLQPVVGAERAVHRRARAGDQEEHLLPLVADALQPPRRRHPRADLPVPDLDRGRARLQQRDRADPAHAHRRPEVPAQPDLRVRAVAVASARSPRAAASSTTRATRRTGPTATPSTSPRRPGRATRSTAASRRSRPTSPGTPRGRQGPARLLRPRQQQAHRVRLGRADRQRRRRGVLPLALGPAWTAPSRAYQYSGALAAAQAYDAIGNTAKANEMRTLADADPERASSTCCGTRTGSCSSTGMSSTNDCGAVEGDQQLLPVRGRRDPEHRHVQAGAAPVRRPGRSTRSSRSTRPTRSTRRRRPPPGNPGSNNFSTINSTVQFRLYSSVLRNYPNQWMNAEDYKKLLYWNAWAQYVGGNTQWPDANEFWADWNGASINYRSWIHHNILGSSNWTVIEDVAGLRPRNDAKVELSPINIGWIHFAVNNLRYRNADLSHRLGRPGRRRRPLQRRARRATRSTSTAPGPPPSTSWCRSPRTRPPARSPPAARSPSAPRSPGCRPPPRSCRPTPGWSTCSPRPAST